MMGQAGDTGARGGELASKHEQPHDARTGLNYGCILAYMLDWGNDKDVGLTQESSE